MEQIRNNLQENQIQISNHHHPYFHQIKFSKRIYVKKAHKIVQMADYKLGSYALFLRR